jgi:hypothetical protein
MQEKFLHCNAPPPLTHLGGSQMLNSASRRAHSGRSRYMNEIDFVFYSLFVRTL